LGELLITAFGIGDGIGYTGAISLYSDAFVPGHAVLAI
jgi:hypothetical protein